MLNKSFVGTWRPRPEQIESKSRANQSAPVKLLMALRKLLTGAREHRFPEGANRQF